MGLHFGQYPSLADGIFLRTWRARPQKGEPKIPPAVRTMMDRGLAEIRSTERGPRLLYRVGASGASPATAGRALMDPTRFAHLKRELGLDSEPQEQP
jgi:hypothetical protein